MSLQRVIPGAVFAGLFVLSFSFNSFADPLNEYTASYMIEKFDSEIGRATYNLERSEDTLHFSLRSKLTGFISLFRKDRLEEDSWLSLHQNQWRLDKYQFNQHGSKRNRNMLVNIDWDSASPEKPVIASGHYAGKEFQTPVDTDIRDALSFQISLMQDAGCTNKPLNYATFAKGEIKPYNFTRASEETLTFNGREINTMLVERHHSSRVTRLWLAIDYQYIPVKIERIENDDVEMLMLIDNLTLAGKHIL